MIERSVSGDIVVAYRKAKANLFRATDQRLFDLADYEASLLRNLTDLEDRISGADESWSEDPDFIGGYSLVPYGIKDPVRPSNSGFVQSNPSEVWKSQFDQRRRADIRFRVYERCSIDMHVLSSLWMQRVGSRLESKIGRESYGNRIRRNRDGSASKGSVGTFCHYPTAYGRWRDRGLSAMEKSLRAGNPVIELTADITSFYHGLDPEFLISEEFLRDVLGVTLSSDDARLNRVFVAALRAWSVRTAGEFGIDSVGIPVGLPASAVVANLALIGLDDIAKNEFSPMYYGRYVDDIILVVRASEAINSQLDLWNWLAVRSKGRISVSEIKGSSSVETDRKSDFLVRYSTSYLVRSWIVFSPSKSKVFSLTVETGLEMIDEIRRNIDERASALRSFTDLPDDVETTAGLIARIVRDNGDSVFDLRDTDGLAVRRSDFAARLRDIETYERDLPSQAWSAQRTAFFEATYRHVLALPHFLSFAQYIPRLIKIAVSCDDWSSVGLLVRGLGAVNRAIEQSCECNLKTVERDGERPSIGDGQLVRIRWRENLWKSLIEAVASALRSDISASCIDMLRDAFGDEPEGYDSTDLNVRRQDLFARDLSHVPVRRALIDPGMRAEIARLGVAVAVAVADRVELDEDVVGAARTLDELLAAGGGVARLSGVVFATRPFNRWELLECVKWGSEKEGSGGDDRGLAAVEIVLRGLRGVQSADLPVMVEKRDDGERILKVDRSVRQGVVRIALVTMDTHLDCLKSAALGKPITSTLRYEQFRAIFREALARPTRPDYILLPELAMPARWFASFANRLNRSGISLVSGYRVSAWR